MTPDQIGELRSFKFYLTYTAQGGATITTPEITLTTVCGPLSADIRLPTISTPYTYQILENEPDAPFIQLAAATNPTNCPIVEWELTSDGVSNTNLNNIDPTVYMEPVRCKWSNTDPAAVDWQCYLNRYADLRTAYGNTGVAAAQAHYGTNGQAEGRDNTCGQCSPIE